MKKAFLWPVIIARAVFDGCYDIVWYSLIIGRPAWMKDRNPMKDIAALFGRTK